MVVPGFPRDTPDTEVRVAIARLGLAAVDARQAVANTITWVNDVPSARALIAAVKRFPLPPARRPIGRPPVLPVPAPVPPPDPRALAAAIIAARPFKSPLELAAVAGVDAEALAQLFWVGWQLLPALPPDPLVGVLLPLRLETRFSPPAGLLGWRLRVRIVPDAASADRHDPLASQVEVDATERMWQDCGADLTAANGPAVWARFAARQGAARAAWLAKSFPAVMGPQGITVDQPSAVRTEPQVNRIVGLPPTLELWMARAGGPPALAATLAVDRSALQLEFPDPAAGVAPWWSSFAKAKAVGLGAELDLGARADDIDALYVVGLGGGDPAGLFAAHRDSGSLSVLPLGVPTNTVDGEPAADLGRDPETWRQVVVGGATGASGTGLVSLALTGRPDSPGIRFRAGRTTPRSWGVPLSRRSGPRRSATA